MFQKIRESRLMYWSLEGLIVVCLIIGLTNLSFLFQPIVTFFSTLLIPFIAAGFLFYLFNPLVNWLGKLKLPRPAAIALIFVVVFGLLGVVIATVIPNLVEQITQLITGLPGFLKTLRQEIAQLSHYRWYQKLDVGNLVSRMQVEPAKLLPKVLGNFSSGVPSFIGSVASIVIGAITIPVLLFYMLKDGNRFVPAVQRLVPERYREEVQTVFTRMNQTLSHYIAGQAIECLFVGTFTFIGYLIIGMPYAFLLGFIAGVVTIIPYLGPYISITPALLIAMTVGWTKVALVIVVVLIVQQTDGNFIYPNVIGHSLNIHPLTIIVLLLVAGNIWGILGTILAVPVYAVLKTVATYVLELYRFHQQQAVQEPLLGKPQPPASKK